MPLYSQAIISLTNPLLIDIYFYIFAIINIIALDIPHLLSLLTLQWLFS